MGRKKINFAAPLRRLPGPAALARFLHFVKLGDKPPANTGLRDRCWVWIGYVDTDGYGGFWYDGRMQLVHRFSYQGFKRKRLKKGNHGGHLCRNTRCCNPGHVCDQPPCDNVAERNHRYHEARRNGNGLPVKPDDDIPF